MKKQKKTTLVPMRWKPEELAQIDQAAKKAGLSRTAFVQQAAINAAKTGETK